MNATGERSESAQHTGSYYAASAKHATDYAPLTGEHSADVCVIGAGFTGIATALNLVERGYKVHVVEANRVGWGASGRNGGQLIGGISGEAKLAPRGAQEGTKKHQSDERGDVQKTRKNTWFLSTFMCLEVSSCSPLGHFWPPRCSQEVSKSGIKKSTPK